MTYQSPITTTPERLIVTYAETGGEIASVVQRPLNLSFTAYGVGHHDLGNRVSGLHGSLEVYCSPGTQTGAATLASLTVSQSATQTLYVRLSVDATNKVVAAIINGTGTVVALTGASAPTLPTGAMSSVKLTWDAEAGTVSLTVNGTVQASSVFSTLPSAVWLSFVPLFLNIGSPQNALVKFVGTIHRVNVSDV